MWQVVEPGRLPGALEDPGVLRAGVYGADGVQEPLAGCALDAAPQLVGSAEQQDVGRVFVVGEADDAGVAVGGAHRVRDAEALQAEHPLAAPGQVVGGRAAHRARADDDGVVALGVVVRHYALPFTEAFA